jgi:hypothetical protein
MSEAVQLAFIAMLQSWGDNFIKILPTLTTAAGTAIVLVGGWWIGRTVKKHGEVVVQRLDRVETAATTSAKDAALMVVGAERNGFKNGIQEGVKQATSEFNSLPQALSPRPFKPESTDVFMRRTDP